MPGVQVRIFVFVVHHPKLAWDHLDTMGVVPRALTLKASEALAMLLCPSASQLNSRAVEAHGVVGWLMLVNTGSWKDRCWLEPKLTQPYLIFVFGGYRRDLWLTTNSHHCQRWWFWTLKSLVRYNPGSTTAIPRSWPGNKPKLGNKEIRFINQRGNTSQNIGAFNQRFVPMWWSANKEAYSGGLP